MKKGTRNNIILWSTISFVILLFALPVLCMIMPDRDEQNRVARLKERFDKEARLEKRLAQEEKWRKEGRLNPAPKYKGSESQNYHAAIAAVKQTITSVSTSGCVYQTGFLEDGVAVFVEKKVYSRILEAAYWVQNGHVYAANGIAKMWSPSISYSKMGIDFDSVEKAVQQRERKIPTSRVNRFENGNLHKATIRQWKNATYQNKLATAGDWLTATLWKGHLNSYKDFDRLKVKAEMLVRALDSSLSAIPVGNEAEDMLVAEAAVFFIHTANDLGPDS